MRQPLVSMDHEQEPSLLPDETWCGGPDLSAPPEIRELARSACDYVRRALGFELDLSSETLPVLDHYLGLVRSELPSRPELLPLVAATVGAYFGEVVRAGLPSFWRAGQLEPEHQYLCLEPVFLAFSPVGVVYDVLTWGGQHEGPSSELIVLPHERPAVESRLRALPAVTPEEYYLLSTRLEVITIAVEALRAERLLRHEGPNCYNPAAYESHLVARDAESR